MKSKLILAAGALLLSGAALAKAMKTLGVQ
jgi:hypothetical protein